MSIAAETADPEVLRIPDLARYLGLGESATRDLCTVPGFPALRIGKVWLVPRSALDRWLAEQAAAGADIRTSRTTARGDSRRRARRVAAAGGGAA